MGPPTSAGGPTSFFRHENGHTTALVGFRYSDPVPVLPQLGKTQHCGTIEDGMILLQGGLNLPVAKKYEIDVK